MVMSDKSLKAEAAGADEIKPASATTTIAKKEGFLDALGQRGTTWKKRYFVLKKNFLHYFKQKGDQRRLWREIEVDGGD